MSGKLKSVLFLFFMGFVMILNIKFNHLSHPKNRLIDGVLLIILFLFFYFGKEKINLYIRNLKVLSRVLLCILFITSYLFLKYLCYSFYYSSFFLFSLSWFFNSDLMIFYVLSYFYILKFSEEINT